MTSSFKDILVQVMHVNRTENGLHRNVNPDILVSEINLSILLNGDVVVLYSLCEVF